MGITKNASRGWCIALGAVWVLGFVSALALEQAGGLAWPGQGWAAVAGHNDPVEQQLKKATEDNAAAATHAPYVTPPAGFQGRTSYFGTYGWSSKAVADECSMNTQIQFLQASGSPRYKQRPYLPVNGKGGVDVTGPYEPVVPWPKPIHGTTTSDWGFGGQGGIYVESPDRVFVLQRDEVPPITRPLLRAGYVWGPDPIMEYVKAPSTLGTRNHHHIMIFDRTGNLVDDSWKRWDYLWTPGPKDTSVTQKPTPSMIFVSPYDPQRHIWVIDDAKITQFTNDGTKLVMTVEDRDPKGSEIGFHGGMGFMPNGDFLVLGTTRVVRFSKDGKYLSEFGKLGSGPGDIGGGVPQGMVVDPATRRIYIGDRANSRIEIFDEHGKFIEEWPNIMSVYSMKLSKDNHLWVAETESNKLLKYDLNGKLITSFGTFGITAGAMWSVHQFDSDSEGNIYLVSDYAGREAAIQKWVPRRDIGGNDPRLMGQLVR